MADGDESKNQATSDGGNTGRRTAITTALIGAGGAVVAAVIGVSAVLLGPQSGGSGGAAAPSGEATSPGGAVLSRGATPSEATSPSTQASFTEGPTMTGKPVTPSAIPKDRTAQYQGTRMLTGSGLDVDHTPPDPSWEDLLYEKRPGRGVMVGQALVSVVWSAPKAPTRAQCVEALGVGLPAGHVFGHAAPGTAFCMWTNVDNVAFVRVAGPEGEEGVPVDIVVWPKQPA
ncbi:hypothetical protein ACFYY8_20490 [Streptosporangium sp. NPDC001559]|uniref:hypothetical protein n=1 Tax=Streptosporangium sp. NPDC001559 TaxID=3366187 RepID=UPI0036E79FD4